MSDSIVVAVRCRPFNKRELQLGGIIPCVTMKDKTTMLLDNSYMNTGKQDDRSFTFDYSYWSVNPVDYHYATNITVYNDLGQLVLENAIHGYNCCLFAYGQTGAGKSYSMVGYGS